MGRKITIQNINTNEIKSFNSISNCITYLNNIAPSNKSTLYRYIELKNHIMVFFVNEKMK